MKIKLKVGTGPFMSGEIIEAVISPNKTQAFFFDSTGCGSYLDSSTFEIVEEEIKTNREVTSLRSLLGQDVKTLEFK